ncbi:mitochondrial ribosomal protein 10 [Pseudovirgaria hyperparasitica]|uniref:Small ribosomal subunit protein mS37 n=1 Tax=Pseudovirgaria hyperparasitica TaxID=470096 RepID=A0A6A6VZI2_9PEZI|nr:mitochondrial ribosomal protein 10 [Pseudovirgaria hyperparasitica]KAF2754727.1 mitochondrial ribosomal protein 10 [Pseudovirgaria hyperparasitica]
MVKAAPISGARSMAARPLPPLNKLRVKKPDREVVNPCISVMSSVLGCWASSGHGIAGCAQVEQQLRACMDAPPGKAPKKNNINWHLSRMYPKIKGPHKKGIHEHH